MVDKGKIQIPVGMNLAEDHEYLVVADANSKILLSTTQWREAVKTANLVRKGGGSCTVFKATKY